MTQDQTTLEHFHVHGWMRVEQAFSASEAAAMREVTWRTLARQGIRRDDRSSWKTERPAHLQTVKEDPAFGAVGSKRLLAVIDEVLEGQPQEPRSNWGAAFLAFPSAREWNVPWSGWHIDANYLSALSPPAGVKTHALYGEIAPRCGGSLIVSGSHRLVHQWFKDHPRPHGTRGAEFRKLLQGHPYIRDLHTEGDADARVERFMETVEEVDGIPLQVVENTGAAGDVLLLHPLVLHVATVNTGREPRFLLSGGIDTAAMWPNR